MSYFNLKQGVTKQIITLLMICLFPMSFASTSDSYLFRAMEDELKRSMEELKFEQFDKPYYISYRMVDSRRYFVSASLGSILKQEEYIQRELIVSIRVGDYKLDNSHLFELNFDRVSSLLKKEGVVAIPIEADYTEVRRQIWLATDAAYKKAVQNLAKKKALLAGKNNTNRADDFLRVEKLRKEEAENISQINIDYMAQTMRKLSELANEYPQIQTSEFDWFFVSSYTRFVNSEGTRIGRNDNTNRILFRAETQTNDGEPLFDEEAIFASRIEDMAKIETLKKEVKSRLAELTKRRIAPPMKTYVGPVLLKPRAAAELIRQTIAKQAIANRVPEKDPSMRIRGFSINTLQGQIKQRILPRGFTMIDDPIATTFENNDLLGSFWADDQGVKSKATTLIKNGRLVQLLSKRSPISEVAVNAGNFIDGSIAASNLILKTRKPYSEGELISEMLELSEELDMDYGIVIERLDGGFDRLTKASTTITFGGSVGLTLDGLSAYKLYKDGRKEQLRQVQLTRFDIRSLRNIIAAGDDASVYHAPSIPIGVKFFLNGLSSKRYEVSSFVTPSLLFEELSLAPQEDISQSLPISKVKTR